MNAAVVGRFPAIRRGGCALALLAVVAGHAEAQVAEGNRAWEADRYADAGRAYERELETNPASVRALYRLAVLASWEGRLDSALVLARRARAVEPADLDVRMLEAQALAWRGDYDAAVARYDSTLAIDPTRTDAAVARARTLGWAGRLDEAEAGYAALLAQDPGHPRALAGQAELAAWRGDLRGAEARYEAALAADSASIEAIVGLARVRHWQGDDRGAERQVARALALDADDPDVRRFQRELRAARRPLIELAAGFSDDSDDNRSFWETLTASGPLAGRVRVFGSAGLQQSSDPLRDADRSLAEAGLIYSLGAARFTAAAGARRLEPDAAPARTEATYRAAAAVRPARGTTLQAAFTHLPFDETALLIGSGLDIDQLDANADVAVTPSTTLSVAGGALWVSDGNRRLSFVGGATQTIASGFYVGALVRRLGWEQPGNGYFAPDRFTQVEGRAGWSAWTRRWNARIGGGLGVQQTGPDGPWQTAWHADARFGRQWGEGNLVELFGSVTNSVASSTTGAYRYGTGGLRIQLGL